MKLSTTTLLFFFGITTVMGQQHWAAEFRPGISIPIEKVMETNLETGFGFEAKVSYYIMPHLSAYAGWGWNQFNFKEDFEGPKIDLEETGYTFGFELILPITKAPLTYFVNAGGIYNHIEIEDSTNNSKVDTNHGLGWQLGAGIAYEFTPKWKLRPELRYRSLSRDLNLDGINSEIQLNYIAIGLGLLRDF